MLRRATGATALVKLGAPTADELGFAKSLRVVEIGGTNVIQLEQDASAGAVSTVVLRASTDQLLDDLERAIDDGVNTYRVRLLFPLLSPLFPVDVSICQRQTLLLYLCFSNCRVPFLFLFLARNLLGGAVLDDSREARGILYLGVRLTWAQPSRMQHAAVRNTQYEIVRMQVLCKDPRVLPAGGAAEMEIARQLSDLARKETGLEQYAIAKFAEALEVSLQSPVSHPFAFLPCTDHSLLLLPLLLRRLCD